ncbi:ABC transporter ATP-binding protein [Aeromicrobium duanguangcaii]|uniref:ABC transporter ATP-binding protein n=1 Tax=Aeromicrobium duanguangcaii TaxID=2968086 RepID=A0ABY5KAE7_9ACTN|nr:ABC transporter ATP-binding protein [Aeromicrobium duanguangcaii]MCL3837228.1 ABC transporter ATP-binding protein [Aeromicrobium duanguangcaii]UUI67259.1 ABC transporter ATP-binding protein [Aeromicrobium duanguangcaii]
MLLQVRGLGKTFGGLDAVKDVDVDVPEGQITAIIGPNGAGKSTLFNLLAGFYAPTSGTVTFEGKDITGMKPHRTVREGIARTFQTTQLFENSTVLDNVLAGCVVRSTSNALDAVFHTPRHRRDERASRAKAMEELEFVGAAHLADQVASNLPQEAQKRVSMALALATEPRLLLLDEPAAGTNDEETAAFGDLIRQMVARGITVCLVEHKMSMVMNLADQIVVLDHGQRIAAGTPEQIKSDPLVIEAYLGANNDQAGAQS